jgi:hypothetical protein
MYELVLLENYSWYVMSYFTQERKRGESKDTQLKIGIQIPVCMHSSNICKDLKIFKT